MRLFAGISIPADITSKLANLSGELRILAEAAHLKLSWTRVDKLHITTKFIGEVPENCLPELQVALTSVAAESAPIDIRLGGLEWMPTSRHPSAFFAAVDPTEPLLAVASATESALESLGITREIRPYRPHVTLARVRHPELAALRSFQSVLAKLPVEEPRFFRASSFHLYLSLSSKYTKLKEFTFLSE